MTATTNTSTSATTANTAAATGDAPEQAKRLPVFYTRQGDKGTPVSLWQGGKNNDQPEYFDGTIGDTRVFGYLQEGAKGGFLSLKDSNAGKDEQGHFKAVGTASVVAGKSGYPKLVITLVGQEDKVWAECSKSAAQDTLVKLGLDVEKLQANKAAYEAEKAAKQTATA